MSLEILLQKQNSYCIFTQKNSITFLLANLDGNIPDNLNIQLTHFLIYTISCTIEKKMAKPSNQYYSSELIFSKEENLH